MPGPMFSFSAGCRCPRRRPLYFRGFADGLVFAASATYPGSSRVLNSVAEGRRQAQRTAAFQGASRCRPRWPACFGPRAAIGAGAGGAAMALGSLVAALGAFGGGVSPRGRRWVAWSSGSRRSGWWFPPGCTWRSGYWAAGGGGAGRRGIRRGGIRGFDEIVGQESTTRAYLKDDLSMVLKRAAVA